MHLVTEMKYTRSSLRVALCYGEFRPGEGAFEHSPRYDPWTCSRVGICRVQIKGVCCEDFLFFIEDLK